MGTRARVTSGAFERVGHRDDGLAGERAIEIGAQATHTPLMQPREVGILGAVWFDYGYAAALRAERREGGEQHRIVVAIEAGLDDDELADAAQRAVGLERFERGEACQVSPLRKLGVALGRPHDMDMTVAAHGVLLRPVAPAFLCVCTKRLIRLAKRDGLLGSVRWHRQNVTPRPRRRVHCLCLPCYLPCK
jgi:hypothetical protein